MKLWFPSKEGWFSNSTYHWKARILATTFSNFVTWLATHRTWKYTWRRTDSNPCDSNRTDEEDGRTWPQITHGRFLSFPWIMWWLGKETDLLLWHCPADRRSMPQDLAPKTTKLKKGDIHVRTRADLMAILWLYKRDICMLTNIHSAQQKVISAMREEKP